MPRMIVGRDGEDRWVEGQVPLTTGQSIYLNTVTGKGIDEAVKSVSDSIYFLSREVSFPNSNKDDIKQELTQLVLDGMRRYDPSKSANMATFLQIHMKNRVIRLYMRHTAQKRMPLPKNRHPYKVVCKNCENFDIIPYKDIDDFKCGCDKPKIKKFGLVPPGLSLNVKVKSEGEPTEAINLINAPFTADDITKSIDLKRSFERLDDRSKKIVEMMVAGHSYLDISKEVSMRASEVGVRVRELAESEFASILAGD